MLRKAGNFLRYLFGILMMLAGAGYWKEEKAYALSLLLLGIFLLPVTWNTIKKRFHVAKALPVLLLSRDNDTNHSIEFCDNRLSRFVASKGKCELSKVSLAFEDVECIYLNPPSQGGTDEYANLRIVHKDIKSLIYSNDVKIIKSLIDLFDCRAPAKIAKLNKWRAKAGLEAINLITINQTLK